MKPDLLDRTMERWIEREINKLGLLETPTVGMPNGFQFCKFLPPGLRYCQQLCKKESVKLDWMKAKMCNDSNITEQ